MPPTRLSVVMPAYQLGEEIGPNVRRVLATFEGMDGVELEVVAVDDGSTDHTGRILDEAAAEDARVRVVHHPTNRGKGQALISGWEAARWEQIVFLDADLDLPPEQIPDLLAYLDKADVVVGTKREAMDRKDYPLLRTYLSRVYSAGTSGMFRLPVKETQTGLKLFHRRVLDRVLPEMRIFGYAFDLELLLRADRAGATMLEVPVVLAESAREASFRPSMAIELAVDTLRLFAWQLTDPGLRRSGRRLPPA